MDHTDLLIGQVTDVFRIGLLAALIYTTERNRAQTGVFLPLVAGTGFVAIIIAMTMPVAGITPWRSMATGLIANVLILVPMWAAWKLVQAKAK
jgi:hypothetical protein